MTVSKSRGLGLVSSKGMLVEWLNPSKKYYKNANGKDQEISCNFCH